MTASARSGAGQIRIPAPHRLHASGARSGDVVFRMVAHVTRVRGIDTKPLQRTPEDLRIGLVDTLGIRKSARCPNIGTSASIPACVTASAPNRW
jgi:hypothetical protein